MAFYLGDQAQASTAFMSGYAYRTAVVAVTDVEVPISAGSIRNLRCRSNVAIPASQTVVLTVMRNGVDTLCTVTLNPANQFQSDVTNVIAFAAGDRLAIKSVTSATTGTLSITASLEHTM